MRTRFSLLAATLAILLCTTFVFAQAPTAPPKPGPEVKKMSVLVGKWTTDVDMKETPMGPAGKMTTSTSCSWIVGGFAVACTETGMMGKMKTTSMSTMAWDAGAKNYVYSEVSSDGQVVVSRGTNDGDTWVFESDMSMGAQMMHGRFTMHYSSKDAGDMKFEMGPNANSMQVVMTGMQKRVMVPAAPKKPATE